MLARLCRGLAHKATTTNPTVHGTSQQPAPSPSAVPLLFFPGILETAASRGGLGEDWTMAASSALRVRAGTHAQQNLTVMLYCQYFLSDLYLH